MPVSWRREGLKMDQGGNGIASHGKLAAAAHEVKNILTGISATLQVLEEQMPETDPQKQIIRELVAEVARLDREVKTLLKEKGSA